MVSKLKAFEMICKYYLFFGAYVSLFSLVFASKRVVYGDFIYVKFICKRSYMVSLFYLLVFISLLYLFSLEFNDFNCLHKLIVNGDFILFLFETTKLKILNCIEWSCVIFSKTINRFKAIFKCLFHYIF